LLGLLDNANQLSDTDVAVAGDDNDAERCIDRSPADLGMALQPGFNRPSERCAPLPRDPAHGDVQPSVTAPGHPTGRPPPENSTPNSSRQSSRQPNRTRYQRQSRDAHRAMVSACRRQHIILTG
jgi:hypothetical protein